MKTRITVLLLFVLGSITGFSQKTHLYNLTADSKESDTVYLGLDNQFLIQDNEHVQVVEPAGIASVINNILVVRPGREGDVRVSLKTKNGVEDFTLHALSIPEYLISITPFTQSKNVSKKDVIIYGKITISSKEINKSADFFRNYSVISCDVVINNKVYSIDDNTFSQEIIKAIADANVNSTIAIQHIRAYNPITKMTIKDEKGCTFLLQ